MISRKRLPRLITQLVCFIAASALLWPLPFWKRGPQFLLQVSPFTAVCAALALRLVGIGTGLGLAAGVAAIVRPRWFCRYACPVGLLVEGVSQVGFRRTGWWTRLPQIGKYGALVTLAGSLVGYPLLLWMDPLAIFSNFLGIRVSYTFTSALMGILLGIVIFLSLTSGLVWCTRLCPLGGTQDLLASAGMIWKRRNRTKEGIDYPQSVSMISAGRRVFIIAVAGIGMGFIARRVGAARGEDAPLRPPGAIDEERFAGVCLRCGSCIRACPSRIIHPDTGEGGIAGLLAPMIHYDRQYCLEDCYACTQVCPSGAIQQLDLDQKRESIIGEALVDGSVCFVTLGQKDCDACEQACPYEAVKIFWDEELYAAYPLVTTDKCNGCGACEVVCPTGKIKAIRIWKRTDKSFLS
jgi:ferredoxin-type protein NapF